jgi:nucleoside-diphosphate-sugar epimerase
MNTKSPTLVTGAGGCIGAWIVRQLLAEEAPVLALDLHRDDRRLGLLVGAAELDRVTWVEADVTHLAALRAVLEDHEVGAVIHLAALQAPFCRADPPLGAAVNVVGTVNLLEALAAGGQRTGPFVYASSIAAAAREGEAHPTTVYGVYKLACEGVADVYLREHGMPSIGLRPHTVYGLGRDQGITSAPTVAMLAAATGAEYEIPFTGRLTMQYAPDVAAAFIAASRATDYEGAGVFDLPGDTVDVDRILAAIEAAAPGAALSAVGEHLPFPADVAPDPSAPFSAALSPTPFADGVAESVTRFRELHTADRIAAPG